MQKKVLLSCPLEGKKFHLKQHSSFFALTFKQEAFFFNGLKLAKFYFNFFRILNLAKNGEFNKGVKFCYRNFFS